MITRLHVAACALALLSACGGGHATSATTSPVKAQPPETRIIALSGNLAFGAVDIGQTVTATVTISNNGNSALNVSNVTVPSGSTFVPNWWKGTIAAGASQPVTVYFSPKEERSYDGVLTVVGDQTAGTNTMNISGTGKIGELPPFSLSVSCGTGNRTFKAGTYAQLACYAVVNTTYPGSIGLRVTADLRAFGLSAAKDMVDPGPTGELGFDLDFQVPAGMPAGPVQVPITATNNLGQTATAIGTIQVTR
jgi:uncharacterized repeat protein (TIGR01451 family)